jgi:hypothetical protein
LTDFGWEGFMKTLVLAASIIVSASTTFARADTVFFDDFNSGASLAWSNTSGNWTAEGGVYRAQEPNNFPNASMSLVAHKRPYIFWTGVKINDPDARP